MKSSLRILIVAEHASARFGGEAILPLHYFRFLRRRQENVWLVVHERTRTELEELLSREDFQRVFFCRDTVGHRLLWKFGKKLPPRIKVLLCDAPMHLLTQLMQRREVKRVVALHSIDIIHEPMPVSARQPSAMFGFSVPVVVGPMNGGMTFPPAFRHMERPLERTCATVTKVGSDFANIVIPGKRRAAKLLVANRRTWDALPKSVSKEVQLMCENGVDLSVWSSGAATSIDVTRDGVQFAFMGRLVDWKAVDILIEAFAVFLRTGINAKLLILGDGPCRSRLERLAEDMGCASQVFFAGFLPQEECAAALARSDVLVLPSLRECGGAVVLEAMAMGKPVIATAWGGPKDYLEGGGGVLIEPDRRDCMVAAFAREMETMAKSEEYRVGLGLEGRRRVETEFSWDLKIDQIISIYNCICQKKAES